MKGLQISGTDWKENSKVNWVTSSMRKMLTRTIISKLMEYFRENMLKRNVFVAPTSQ